MRVGGVGLVRETDVCVQVEIHEDSLGGFEELGRGSAHHTGEHANGVCDVGASLRGGVEAGANDRLETLKELLAHGQVGGRVLCVGDELSEVYWIRRLVRVDEFRNSVREETRGECTYVRSLV